MLVVMGEVILVVAMQRVFGAVGVWLFAAFVMMAVMMVGVLAVRVFVAVVPFAVVNIFRGGGVGRGWSILGCHRNFLSMHNTFETEIRCGNQYNITGKC